MLNLVRKQREMPIIVWSPKNGEKPMRTPMAKDNEMFLLLPLSEASFKRVFFKLIIIWEISFQKISLFLSRIIDLSILVIPGNFCLQNFIRFYREAGELRPEIQFLASS